jgi:hypothetical protein
MREVHSNGRKAPFQRAGGGACVCGGSLALRIIPGRTPRSLSGFFAALAR